MKNRLSGGRIGFALKRILDVLLGASLLLLSLPAMVVISGGVLVSVGYPLFFRQKRIGLRGEEFELLKFRTMTDARDESGTLLPDEYRLTRTGRLLRSMSLDELPELINVLRGEMALVGPRPLLPEYRDLYSPEQWRRHDMRPGLAGPVVASGRNSLSWEEKLALDVWYVENWSLSLDVRLLVRSAWKVLKREGISAAEHATMPRFEGKSAAEGSVDDE